MKITLTIIICLILNNLCYSQVDYSKDWANSGWGYSSVENSNSDSSEFIRTDLYKGTLNGTIKIWLYLKEQEHPCGGNITILDAMYKYDNQEKWLLLNVTTDKEKKRYCLVEDNFTGVLFLKRSGDFLNGNWISPNTQKQFKIKLEKVKLDKATIEKLDETLFDDLIYNKNDC